MSPCPRCGAFVRSGRPCPGCDIAHGVPRLAVAALLGLSACVGTTTKDSTGSDTGDTATDTPTTGVEPPYGVPTSTSPTSTDTDTDPGTSTDTDAETGGTAGPAR